MDQKLERLMKQLGEAINDSISDSEQVAEVIARIKSGGYDIFVVLEATVGFNKREARVPARRALAARANLSCASAPRMRAFSSRSESPSSRSPAATARKRPDRLAAFVPDGGGFLCYHPLVAGLCALYRLDLKCSIQQPSICAAAHALFSRKLFTQDRR